MANVPILLIDNRDSFTINLAQIVRETPGFRCEVVRHDNVKLNEIARYAGIILSPGPGLPHEFPEMFDIIDRYKGVIPILGVCLGHQAIAEYFGAKLLNLEKPLHGERTQLTIEDKNEPLFKGVQDSSVVGLYHSWVVDERTLPSELRVTARSESSLVMALRHQMLNVRGVQFHPESYMTEHGTAMLQNWLQCC